MKRLNAWISAATLGLATSGAAFAQQATQQNTRQEAQAGEHQAGQQEAQRPSSAQQQAKLGEEHQLEGKVTAARGKRLFVETTDGAVLPFELDNTTRYEGQTQPEGRLTSARQLQPGDSIGITFITRDGLNYARHVSLSGQPEQSISGKVASISSESIVLDYQGALLPIAVGRGTTFEGQTREGEQLQTVQQIRPGDDVRASFVVRNETENFANTIQLEAQQGTERQTQPQQPTPSQPPQEETTPGMQQ